MIHKAKPVCISVIRQSQPGHTAKLVSNRQGRENDTCVPHFECGPFSEKRTKYKAFTEEIFKTEEKGEMKSKSL